MAPDKNHSGSTIQQQSTGSRSRSTTTTTTTTTATTRINSAATTTPNNSVFGGFETLLKRKSFLANALIGLGQSDSKNHLLQEICDHPTGVNCLALSEDRSLLVSGGEDSVVRLWSTFSTPCECIGVLCGHKDYITCCTVHQFLVISGSADCTLRLWSIETGYCLMILTGHQAFVSRCSTYGAILLSTSFDNTVRVWALTEQLTIIQSIRHDSVEHDHYDEDDDDDDEIMEPGLSDQDKDDDRTDLDSTTTGASYKHRMEKFRRQNGETVLVNKRTVPVKFGKCLWILDGHKKSVTQSAIVNQDDSSLLKQGIIQELDLIITTSIDGKAMIYSLATGQLRHVLLGHRGPINCLAIDGKESRFIYTAGGDSVIKNWDVITGEFIKDLSGHEGSILCLLSHNRILYSGSMDRTVRAWAMEFGQCTRVYYQSTAPVSCLQYFKGIRCNDYCARLYDSNSAVLKKTFSGHRSPISALQVIPGKLFTSSFDGRILVWDCKQVQADKTDTTKLRPEDVGNNVSQALIMKMVDRQTLNRSISSVSSSLIRQTNAASSTTATKAAATTSGAAMAISKNKHRRKYHHPPSGHQEQSRSRKSRSSSSMLLMEDMTISSQLSELFQQQQPQQQHDHHHNHSNSKHSKNDSPFDPHKSYDDDDGCLPFLSYYCCWLDWIKMFNVRRWRWPYCCCCFSWCCCDGCGCCFCFKCCSRTSTQTTPGSRQQIIQKHQQNVHHNHHNHNHNHLFRFSAFRSKFRPTKPEMVYDDGNGADDNNHHHHHQQTEEELDSENVRHAIEALEPYIRSFK